MRKLGRNNLFTINIYAWLLLFPSLIFLALFTFYPIWQTVYLSFFQLDLGTPEALFTGWDNYQRLMEDEVFWKVLKNNIWFALGTVPTSILLGMVMAIALNKAMIGRSWLRTFFFYPTVIPMIAIANIWMFIYTPEYGLFSQVLSWLGMTGPNWLGNGDYVLWAMVIMMIWKEAGFFMIFFLAGLQNISKELYESAEIDGAGPWIVFRRITFPLLMPTTLFVSVIALTNSFKLVDHLVIMTQGGPNNASNLLLYYIYEVAFSYWDQGQAATLTVVMLIIMVILASIQFLGLDKRIHYS